MSAVRRLLLLSPPALAAALPGVIFMFHSDPDRAPARTPAAVAGLMTASALLVGVGTCRWNGRRPEARTGALIVVAFALLVPLAAETQAQAVRGAAALTAACLAAVLLERPAARARFWAVPAVAVACGLDATAVILPAAALATLPTSDRSGKTLRVLLPAAGLAGLATAWAAGWPMVPARSAQQAYAAHRDLAVLLPLVTVALAGWLDGAAGRDAAPGRPGDPAFRRAWGAASLAVAGLIAAGLDAGVSMACLGLWWLVPAGLDRLRCLATAEGPRNAPARRLAWLCGALLAFTLSTPLSRWRDGLLFTLYLLAG